MKHLTAAQWEQFQAGMLAPQEASLLRAHLAEPCETCEALLAEMESADALDISVDAALAGMGPPPSSAELRRLARLEKRVRRAVFGRREAQPRGWPRQLWGPALGLVTGCAATALVLLVGPLSSQRLKGSAGDARAPGLTALVAERGPGGEVVLSRLDPGRAYPPSAELYPTYELPQPAHVYVVRVGADGAAELFYPPPGTSAQEPAGIHPLAVGGVVHSYALDGLSGWQRFVLLASTGGPLSRDAALSLARAPPREGPVQAAHIDLVVEPR